MCGIAGIVAPDARHYHGHLQRMVTALGHRGPDGTGSYVFDHCALGHVRLSVVDLHTGQQPMLSGDSSVAISFNGEIYGYKPIRAEMKDYRFRTTSDTEVILALYEQYNTRLLSRLPGMFAFALWDETRHELFCARDRFGEKPLFYAFGPNGEFLFASEIKALLASGLVKPVLNRDALTHYLKFLYVQPTQTIYQNVHPLPSAHYLRYRDGRLSIERYWQPPQTRHNIQLKEAVQEFERLLDQAVARALVADVPVGAFLSGGLDSSTIVALASRHHAALRTFSFDFEDSASELSYAREVAQLYNTQHVELSDRRADVADLLETMQGVFDEPFADSSNIPTWLISKLARQHVKVVLTGDGGDELLAGYSNWYRPLWYMQKNFLPLPGLINLLRLAVRWSHRYGLTLESALLYRLQGIQYRQRYDSIRQAHVAQKQYFTESQLVQLGFSSYAVPSKALAPPKDSLDDALRMDIEEYLTGDILVKIDRASMAHGLELRSPFLDVDLASFCISLPTSLKLSNNCDKLILREAFSDAWPGSLRTRDKQGFGAPVNHWFKREAVRKLKDIYLNDPKQKLFSLLPFAQTRAFVSRDDYLAWILLVLAIWVDRHDVEMSQSS